MWMPPLVYHRKNHIELRNNADINLRGVLFLMSDTRSSPVVVFSSKACSMLDLKTNTVVFYEEQQKMLTDSE
jgi:hypothetical protein